MLAWIRMNVFQCDESDAQYQAEYQVKSTTFFFFFFLSS